MRNTDEERFWAKVEKTESCWNWTGAQNGHGYGIAWVNGRNTKPHRYSYEMVHGPIQKGMFIDHLCHNRACVNPAHLRTVTRKQNNENHSGAQSDSKTGVRGVVRRANGKYVAATMHDGARYSAGTFASLAEAEAAVIALRNRLYTHNDADRRPR